uniref:Secreted protein n=1 Tax=Zea mays TaxID=4577 RepID=C4JBT9_MAIZE|nr:unknown [Zea mays]
MRGRQLTKPVPSFQVLRMLFVLVADRGVGQGQCSTTIQSSPHALAPTKSQGGRQPSVCSFMPNRDANDLGSLLLGSWFAYPEATKPTTTIPSCRAGQQVARRSSRRGQPRPLTSPAAGRNTATRKRLSSVRTGLPVPRVQFPLPPASSVSLRSA